MTDECDDSPTVRLLANSVKTFPKVGTLWRSLLNSAFGMITMFMAVRARIVAFRDLSEKHRHFPEILATAQGRQLLFQQPVRAGPALYRADAVN